MKLVYYLEYLLSPVPNYKQGSICMVEKWNVKYTAVTFDEVLKRDPLFWLYVLIDYVYLFVTGGQSDFLLKLSNVGKHIHLVAVKLMHLIFKLCTH